MSFTLIIQFKLANFNFNFVSQNFLKSLIVINIQNKQIILRKISRFEINSYENIRIV